MADNLIHRPVTYNSLARIALWTLFFAGLVLGLIYWQPWATRIARLQIVNEYLVSPMVRNDLNKPHHFYIDVYVQNVGKLISDTADILATIGYDGVKLDPSKPKPEQEQGCRYDDDNTLLTILPLHPNQRFKIIPNLRIDLGNADECLCLKDKCDNGSIDLRLRNHADLKEILGPNTHLLVEWDASGDLSKLKVTDLSVIK